MSISGNQFKIVTAATLTGLAVSFPVLDGSDAHSVLSKVHYERRTNSSLAGNSAVKTERASVSKTVTGAITGLVPPQELAASLKAQRAYLMALPPNWDGYGAAPISGRLLDVLESEVIQALRGIDCRPPDIIPGGNGSLQAEWHMNGLEIGYSVNRNGARYLSVITPEMTLEYFDEEALPAFLKWAPRLSRKAALTPVA